MWRVLGNNLCTMYVTGVCSLYLIAVIMSFTNFNLYCLDSLQIISAVTHSDDELKGQLTRKRSGDLDVMVVGS